MRLELSRNETFYGVDGLNRCEALVWMMGIENALKILLVESSV